MSRQRKVSLLVSSLFLLLVGSACGILGRNDAPPPAVPVAQPVQPQPVQPQPAQPQQQPQPNNQLIPGAANDFLQTAMNANAQRFAPGMTPATPLFRGNLATGATQDFQAVLQAAKCFKIIGVGGPTVTDLDLMLFDPSGTQLQQDIATDNYPVLGLTDPICPAAPGTYRVQVRMYQGQGDFAVQIFSN